MLMGMNEIKAGLGSVWLLSLMELVLNKDVEDLSVMLCV